MGFEDYGWEIMIWIHMAEARDMGQALATMIMNFCIP